jgi:export-related chaperone CsaA
MATIDEFALIELRVGRIIEVEDLETARKPMYKMKIDLGELGIRNIAAGLKSFYTKEELLNSLVIVVANLEPKSIAGFLSEGMILAADDGANVVVLRPDKDIAVGSRVR